MTQWSDPIFVACAPGLEAIVVAELAAMGLSGSAVAGGVEVAGGMDVLYRCNLEVGTGLRVLVRLGRFRAKRWGALVDGVAALDWGPWLDRAGAVSIKVKAVKSRLYHSGGIAERVRAGIEGALGSSLEERESASVLPVMVRIVRDECVVSIDSTGELLSRRGYRLAVGKAPLREDLARAAVIASGWDRRSALMDPMCGSGTLAIEAAMLASGRAPGSERQFAFQATPGFDGGLWERLLAESRERENTELPPIFASDRDAGVVEMAAANAARAGVKVSIAQAPLSAAPGFDHVGSSGALVCNPPYGLRIGGGGRNGGDLRPLYQRLGEVVRERIAGCKLALVVHQTTLARTTGLPLTSVLMTDHGGRKIYFFVSKASNKSSR